MPVWVRTGEWINKDPAEKKCPGEECNMRREKWARAASRSPRLSAFTTASLATASPEVSSLEGLRRAMLLHWFSDWPENTQWD